MREGRLSAGISSDAGIKERAASSFGEIVRAEARRIRFGMGLLATIGATSPFVGLFGDYRSVDIRCRHPRRPLTQYSRGSSVQSRSRGVLDTPPGV